MSTRSSVPWGFLAQFAYSGFVLLGAAGLALALILATVGGTFRPGGPVQVEPSQNLLWAAGSALVGALMIPSGVLALRGLLSESSPPAAPAAQAPQTLAARVMVVLAMVAAWALSLWAGSALYHLPPLGNLLLPVCYVLVTGLPVLAFLTLGMGGLVGGSARRRWGLFTADLVGNSMLVLVVELVGYGLLAAVLMGVIASQPQALQTFQQLAQRLLNARFSPDAINRILRPYLLQPWVIYLGLSLVSGVAPLIEELLKPLPLWLLARRGLSPSEGFVGGLLCGAGFALFESLTNMSQASSDTWIVLGVGRAGTDLLHMLNAGLMGWALASAWKNGRFLKLGLTYLFVIATHGLWNAISLSMGLIPLLNSANVPGLQFLSGSQILPSALGVLFSTMLVILLAFNQHLQPREAPVETPG